MSGGGRNRPEDYLRIAKVMGAAKVLAKPFENEELIAAIDELLSDGKPPLQPPSSNSDFDAVERLSANGSHDVTC